MKKTYQAFKVPSLAARRKASTRARCCSKSTFPTADVPCTRRCSGWPVASAAGGERPTTSPIVSNGTANTSCRTNATRSSGASESSTTNSAAPTDSARSAASAGSFSAAESSASGTSDPRGVFRTGSPRPQAVEADPSGHGGEPPGHVLDRVPIGAHDLEPCLLDGVFRLGPGSEHPIRHALQTRAVGLELPHDPLRLVHRPSSARRTHPQLRRRSGPIMACA